MDEIKAFFNGFQVQQQWFFNRTLIKPIRAGGKKEEILKYQHLS
jgi:hypothetical protein